MFHEESWEITRYTAQHTRKKQLKIKTIPSCFRKKCFVTHREKHRRPRGHDVVKWSPPFLERVTVKTCKGYGFPFGSDVENRELPSEIPRKASPTKRGRITFHLKNKIVLLINMNLLSLHAFTFQSHYYKMLILLQVYKWKSQIIHWSYFLCEIWERYKWESNDRYAFEKENIVNIQ